MVGLSCIFMSTLSNHIPKVSKLFDMVSMCLPTLCKDKDNHDRSRSHLSAQVYSHRIVFSHDKETLRLSFGRDNTLPKSESHKK